MDERKSSGSINSGFQFLNYKIDSINLVTEKNLAVLNLSGIKPENVKLGLFIRDVNKYTKEKKTYFMGGIEAKLEISDNKNKFATGLFGIEGLFIVLDDNFTEEQKDNLVKKQIPSILFPYLRSAVTNILASAGFGSIVFPLINVYNLVSKQDKQHPIKIVDAEKKKNTLSAKKTN